MILNFKKIQFIIIINFCEKEFSGFVSGSDWKNEHLMHVFANSATATTAIPLMIESIMLNLQLPINT